MHRLLHWYTLAIGALAFGLLYATCSYAINHFNFVLKTDRDVCRDITGRNAHLCDHIDWRYTDDFHLGNEIATCLERWHDLKWPAEWCYPNGMNLRDGGWTPEHFPVATPRPMPEPANARPSD